MSKFYLQVQTDGTITDAITFPYKDYVEVELDYLPQGVYGGWWKLENGELVEYPELKPIDEASEIEQLKQSQTDQDDLIMDLYMGRL